MRFLLGASVLLLAALAGCSGNPVPLVSHGKPIAYWLQEMRKPEAKARQKAVVALGHVGAADPAALRALMSAVKDAHAGVRAQAVLALLQIGPAATDAIPVLTEARNDKDAAVRSYAAKALERIQR